jgi:hypothetical protein
MGEEVRLIFTVGVVVLVVLISVFIYLIAKTYRTKTIAAWKQAATELGFNFTPPGTFDKYTMNGMIGQQLSCSVWAHTEKHGKNSSTYMNYDVRFSQPLNLGLVVKREGAILGKIAKLSGKQDIHTNNHAFDKAFTIKGADEYKVKEFLTPHIQSKLLEARNVLKNLEVSDFSVNSTRMRGFIRKPEILVQNVKLLIQLAELIIPNEEVDSIFD